MTDLIQKTIRKLQLLWLVPALVNCAGTLNDACTAQDLAAIEAHHLAEVVAACKAEGSEYDDCKARPAIDAKYAALREEWIACR